MPNESLPLPIMKRRSLVLTSESARHPFRASLPPRVFVVPKMEAEVEAAMARNDRLISVRAQAREAARNRAEVIGDISIICFFGLVMAWLQPSGF